MTRRQVRRRARSEERVIVWWRIYTNTKVAAASSIEWESFWDDTYERWYYVSSEEVTVWEKPKGVKILEHAKDESFATTTTAATNLSVNTSFESEDDEEYKLNASLTPKLPSPKTPTMSKPETPKASTPKEATPRKKETTPTSTRRKSTLGALAKIRRASLSTQSLSATLSSPANKINDKDKDKDKDAKKDEDKTKENVSNNR